MGNSKRVAEDGKSEYISPVEALASPNNTTESSQHNEAGVTSARMDNNAESVSSTHLAAAVSQSLHSSAIVSQNNIQGFRSANTGSTANNMVSKGTILAQNQQSSFLASNGMISPSFRATNTSNARHKFRTHQTSRTLTTPDNNAIRMEAQSTKPFVPHTTFFKFPKLPLEIRTMILRLGVSKEPDRIIEVNHQGLGRYVTDAKTPALLHACRDSRYACFRYYDMIHWKNEEEDPFFTNPMENRDYEVPLEVVPKAQPRKPRDFFAFINYSPDALYFSYFHFTRDESAPIDEDQPHNFQYVSHTKERSPGQQSTMMEDLRTTIFVWIMSQCIRILSSSHRSRRHSTPCITKS
ncbi:hypothetical protein BKA65DRAFT_556588 [Rhexocercosporidium sp. MPI-PUGE-AT-0058]|nr:hypothetical protein BKA65DRAFT_556588 [Rhexocercosporidium sp. MPI-PUGE-AT-0058]